MAILVTSALAVAISFYAAAFTVLTSISTIALYLAYGIPIFLNFRNRLRRQGEFTTHETAAWNLGRGSLSTRRARLDRVHRRGLHPCLRTSSSSGRRSFSALALSAYWRAYARRHFRGPSSGP